MADETYDELLGKLADHKFAGVSDSLRLNLVDYYGDVNCARRREIREQLAQLDAVMSARPEPRAKGDS